MIFELEQATVEATRIGDKSGEPVVLLPGCGRMAADLEPIARLLAEAGFQPWLLENRGVGGSQGPAENLTLHDFAADVSGVVQQLAQGPAHVIGHAFGNRVARCLAMDEPGLVKSVVLLAAGGTARPRVDLVQIFTEIIKGRAKEPETYALIEHAFFGRPANGAWQAWCQEAIPAQMTAAGITPLEEWWSGGSTPMLVVHGMRDRAAPSENVDDLELGKERILVARIPEVGHALPVEDPQAVADAVIPFLRQVSAGDLPEASPKPTYALKGHDRVRAVMRERSAKTNGAFLLEELRDGMRLLDCGCCDGRMTVEFAELAGLSEAVGIDINPEEIEDARRHAVDGVSFEVASATELPFDSASFDAVFMHTLLMHLQDPDVAIAEAYRVLRPGGVLAVSDGDWGADIVAPTLPAMVMLVEKTEKELLRRGVNVHFGRQHRRLLHQGGFRQLVTSLFSESWSTQDEIHTLAELWKGEINHPQADIALDAWARHPGAFYARSRCQTIGRKP